MLPRPPHLRLLWPRLAATRTCRCQSSRYIQSHCRLFPQIFPQIKARGFLAVVYYYIVSGGINDCVSGGDISV